MPDDAETRYIVHWTPADAPVYDDDGIDPDLVEDHAVDEVYRLETRAASRAIELSRDTRTLHGHVQVTRQVRDDEVESGVLLWRNDYRWIFEDGGISDKGPLGERI